MSKYCGKEDKRTRGHAPNTAKTPRLSRSPGGGRGGPRSSEPDAALMPTGLTVWDIPHILDQILRYVIFDADGRLSRQAVLRVRRVHKRWLQSTTDLLRRSKTIIKTLTLTEDAYSFSQYGDKSEKVWWPLGQVFSVFETKDRPHESFLPLEVIIKRGFFCERNYNTFLQLTRLGTDLVSLRVAYPRFGGKMPVTFPSFQLTALNELTFRFKDPGIDDADGADDSKGLSLLQAILNGSTYLQKFVIPYARSYPPPYVDFLHIPNHITELHLGIHLTCKQYVAGILSRNTLPNVTHLALQAHPTPLPPGLLYQILAHFKTRLRIFDFDGYTNPNGQPISQSVLQFPVMEQLTDVSIVCSDCVLDPAQGPNLQQFLPQLTAVALVDQLEDRLSTWLIHSVFDKVKTMHVSVINAGFSDADDMYRLSPSPQLMGQLHQTFPHVRTASLDYNENDLSSLEYLFSNFTGLTELTITLTGNIKRLTERSDRLDCTLLGLPMDMVEFLKRSNWCYLNMESAVKDLGKPTIGNLADLQTFNLLWSHPSDDDYPDGPDVGNKTLISDLLFHQAFMKMTKLRTLVFREKLGPSLAMRDAWRRGGGVMQLIK